MTVMTKQAKQAKRDYEKRWRHDNPDKVREIRARYWERKAAKQNKAEEGEGNERSENPM